MYSWFRNIASLGVALWLCPSFAGADIKATVKVEVTGETENGLPWDGRRVYPLPLEMGTVSPPDLALCSFTLRGEPSCQMRDSSRLISFCPNRNHCSFDIDLPDENIFGFAVFDLDTFGRDRIDSVVDKLDDALSTVDTRAGCGDFLVALLCGARERTEQARKANEARMEWIDAIIFSDDPRSKEVSVLADRMRAFVAANAPFGKNSNPETQRIGGRFSTQSLMDCAYPAPACRLDYSFLEIEIHEEDLS